MQLDLGDVCRVVVLAGLARSVPDEVFQTGDELIWRAVLIATHHGRAHPAGQPGVLTEALSDTPPSRVPTDVEHRRERPVHALLRGFPGRDARGLLDQRLVPACRHAQRDRKHGFEAVDHVTSNQQRYAVRTLVPRQRLQLLHGGRIHLVDHRSDKAFGNLRAQRIGNGAVAPFHLNQLPDLLLDVHRAKQLFCATARRLLHCFRHQELPRLISECGV